MKYRHRPTEVEAVEITDDMCWDSSRLPEWSREFVCLGLAGARIELDTPVGKQFLFAGYFIVKNNRGSLEVFSGQRFSEEFEEVKE